jgi:hypothetical protein
MFEMCTYEEAPYWPERWEQGPLGSALHDERSYVDRVGAGLSCKAYHLSEGKKRQWRLWWTKASRISFAMRLEAPCFGEASGPGSPTAALLALKGARVTLAGLGRAWQTIAGELAPESHLS